MTPEDHRAAAESLIEQSRAVYAELREVPEAGILREGSLPGQMLFVSQSERRDELGKDLRGKYALAQVHATLYAADTAWLASGTTRTRSTPWAQKPIEAPDAEVPEQPGLKDFDE